MTPNKRLKAVNSALARVKEKMERGVDTSFAAIEEFYGRARVSMIDFLCAAHKGDTEAAAETAVELSAIANFYVAQHLKQDNATVLREQRERLMRVVGDGECSCRSLYHAVGELDISMAKIRLGLSGLFIEDSLRFIQYHSDVCVRIAADHECRCINHQTVAAL